MSQALDNTLNTQKPQYDKSGIGFKGKSSCMKNNARSYANILSSHPKVEKEEAKWREDICEKREAQKVSLRKELEQVKRSWQSSQALDNILNTQKPQYDKSGIGFKGESSSTKNNARSYASILSSHPKEEKSSR